MNQVEGIKIKPPHQFRHLGTLPLEVQSTIQQTLGLELKDVPNTFEALSQFLFKQQQKIDKLPWEKLKKDQERIATREEFLSRGEASIKQSREEIEKKSREADAKLELAQSAFAFQEAYETVRDDIAKAVARAMRDTNEEY